MSNIDISGEEIESLYVRMKTEIESGGYHFNPDLEFTKSLIEGLLVNQKRYGYISCPCRLASGKKDEDLDIICPCDYRDPDLSEFNACYCCLFVTKAVVDGTIKAKPIPERRPTAEEKLKIESEKKNAVTGDLKYPVWRCRVCGYLCARETPPEVCPICKVKKERFERFL